MARYSYIVLFFSLFLASCAQVGTISGGEEDTHAPKPLSEEIIPPNASTLFTNNHVEIPFDEFFKLNNPQQTITMVPPHATIDASVKGKTLLLDWEQELQPNTTYAIYMNGAIKDLTEGNDSLMQYVFSTGETIDSLSYSVHVSDAWENTYLKDITIGCFNEEGTLVNLAKTNAQGKAQLNYLREGRYSILAFNDLNQDATVQPNEPVGFPDSNFVAINDSSVQLNKAIRVFTPNKKPAIRTLNYKAPGSFVLGVNRTLENEVLFFDETPVDTSRIVKLAEDSLLFFIPKDAITSGNVILQSTLLTDTSSYRVLESKKDTTVRLKCTEGGCKYAPSKRLSFTLNDYITDIDTSKIVISNSTDSTIISDVSFSVQKHMLYVDIDRSNKTLVKVELEKGALSTLSGSSNAFTSTIEFVPIRKYGTLLIDVSQYTSPIIIDVLFKKNKITEYTPTNNAELIRLNEMTPGEYTFRVIHDSNENGSWDVGDFDQRIQPEIIDLYEQSTTVRANWDVEVLLAPSNPDLEDDKTE